MDTNLVRFAAAVTLVLVGLLLLLGSAITLATGVGIDSIALGAWALAEALGPRRVV